MTTHTLSPTAPGDSAEWPAFPTGPNWSLVTSSDGNTTYVYETTATGSTDRHITSKLPLSFYPVRVIVKIEARPTTAGGTATVSSHIRFLDSDTDTHMVYPVNVTVSDGGDYAVYRTYSVTHSEKLVNRPWKTMDLAVSASQVGYFITSMSSTNIRITKAWIEVDGAMAPGPTYALLQISGSGDPSEPNNAAFVEPLDIQFLKSARVNVLKIPNKDGGVVQWGGADNASFQMRAVVLGHYDDAASKRDALDNLVWHSSSTSWRARPLTLSVVINGELKEQFPVVLESYDLQQRRGRHNIHDISINLTKYTD